MAGQAPKRPTGTSRRAYLATLGSGVLCGLAGCGRPSGGVESTELGVSDGDSDEQPSARWTRHVRLTLTDDVDRGFGQSVALADDGETALVSDTHHERSEGLEPGPGYVLERSESGWLQRATLVPDNGDWDMHFGGEGESTALAADATTALVGANRADEPNGPEAGSAYVFERSEGTWDEGTKLVPDDGGRKDFFGKSVALSADGTTALVGAWGNDRSTDGGTGSAYVFERTESEWSQSVTLAPDGTGAFGWSVELARDGRTAVVGAPGEDRSGEENVGSVYVYRRADAGWRQQATFGADDGDSGDFFGAAVTLADRTILVGAAEDDDPNGPKAGSAYVFERSESGWKRTAKLVPADGDSTDLFGITAALSADGTTALVGARVDDDPNGPEAGSTYVFERTETGWRQVAKLAPSDGEADDVFGRSVALANDTALVGTARGAAYVF